MFQYYQLKDHELCMVDEDQASIVFCFAPTVEERRHLLDVYQLDLHTLQSSLDPAELSRIDYNPMQTAFIFKWPTAKPQNGDEPFQVTSIGAFRMQTQLVIVTDAIVSLDDFRLQNKPINDLNDVLLMMVHHSTLSFHRHFEMIRKLAYEIENRLLTSMNNQLLLDLFNLQKSLTFYQDAIGSNMLLIERMQRDHERLGFRDSQYAFIDDMIVDNKQCYNQAEIAANIIENMTDTLGSLINNKLSTIMKRLTIISLIFLPINAIAGIGGMSEYTTFATQYMSGYAAYGLLIIALGMVAYSTYALLHWLKID